MILSHLYHSSIPFSFLRPCPFDLAHLIIYYELLDLFVPIPVCRLRTISHFPSVLFLPFPVCFPLDVDCSCVILLRATHLLVGVECAGRGRPGCCL